MGVFLGTISRNSSSIIGKQINVSMTINAPAGGIANDVTFFYINKSILPVVSPIVLRDNYAVGYIYSNVNDAGDTIFAARVYGGIPAGAGIQLNFNCFIV